MKFTGTVHALEDHADNVAVSIGNVRQKYAAAWRGYGKTLVFDVTHAQSKAFYIGRSVEIVVKARGER